MTAARADSGPLYFHGDRKTPTAAQEAQGMGVKKKKKKRGEWGVFSEGNKSKKEAAQGEVPRSRRVAATQGPRAMGLPQAGPGPAGPRAARRGRGGPDRAQSAGTPGLGSLGLVLVAEVGLSPARRLPNLSSPDSDLIASHPLPHSPPPPPPQPKSSGESYFAPPQLNLCSVHPLFERIKIKAVNPPARDVTD